LKLSRKKIANNTWSVRENNLFFDIFYQEIKIGIPVSFFLRIAGKHTLSNSQK